jgi:hypothetical protein
MLVILYNLYCLLITGGRVFRMPEIPTHVAGSQMMKGILEEQRIFSVPGHMLTMVPIIRYENNFV